MKNAILFALDPQKHPKTRIMATVGLSSSEYPILREMVKQGATFFRFNGAHIENEPEPGQLSWDKAREIAENIRRLRSEFRRLIGLYFDLGGPKVRVLHVLSVQRRAAVDGQSRKLGWLKPILDDKVIIHPFNSARDRQFRQEMSAFEANSLGGTAIDWDDPTHVERFYESRQTDHTELMLGKETTSVGDFVKGSIINLKDGWCRLSVDKVTATRLVCDVEYVGSKFEYRPRQGASPLRYAFDRVITSKDERDIHDALRIGADIISLSFVCSPYDARDVRHVIDREKAQIIDDETFMRRQSGTFREYISPSHRIPVFAKIETVFAVDYEECRRYAIHRERPQPDEKRKNPIEEIIDKFDGVMVARGDLAVEVDKYGVPDLQRRIIDTARLYNKPVIVATEMLESMRGGDDSTRAEIGDINRAVHQEADILMLSGETSSTKGKPARAVEVMRLAIEYAERERLPIDTRKNFQDLQVAREPTLETVARDRRFEPGPAVARLSQGNQVCLCARALDAHAIIASARTGAAVREIAYYRPAQKIIAVTEDTLTSVKLLQHRGVYPVVMEHPISHTVDEFVDIANQIHEELGIPAPGDDRETFRLPALIRVLPIRGGTTGLTGRPEDSWESEGPNSIQEFELPSKPLPRPEKERKYILSELSYRKLFRAMQDAAVHWDLREQTNFYYEDGKAKLSDARVMVRLRAERLIDSVGGSRLNGHTEVTFAVKGPSSATSIPGEASRPEQEFNVTRDFADVIADEGPESVDLSHLPEFYHRYPIDRWSSLIGSAYQPTEAIDYRLAAKSRNRRLTSEMANGFVLELDSSTFPMRPGYFAEAPITADPGLVEAQQYELEVEVRGDDSSRRLLDEYIHDKFAYLDIPVVSPSGYPSKLERTRAYAGLLRAEELRRVLEEVRKVAAAIAGDHKSHCEQCSQFARRVSDRELLSVTRSH